MDIWSRKPKAYPSGIYGKGEGVKLNAFYLEQEMDAWLEELWKVWFELKLDATMYQSIKDIEIDIKSKLKFWNREDEEPSLMAQNLLGVAAIDELAKRYIDQGKKLEAVKKIIKEFNDNSEERGPIPTKGLSEAYEAFLRIEEVLETEK